METTFYSIDKETKVINVCFGQILSSTHFDDLFSHIISDDLFSDEYNFVFNSVNSRWNHSTPSDIQKAADRIRKRKKRISSAACVIQNLGQIAYLDALLLGSERFIVTYFPTEALALRFLGSN